MMFRIVAALLIALIIGPVVAQDKLGGASKPTPHMSASRSVGQYKRVHQYALRLILLDRDDEAEAFLNAYLEDHHRDAETSYMLGVLYAHRHQPEQAVTFLRRAIQLGLPAERAIAGPRALLAEIENKDFFQVLRAHLAHRPLHGPMVGNVTDRTASFWVRTANESNVTVKIAESSDLQNPVRTPASQTSRKDDYTTVVRCDGLKAATRYHYEVCIDGHEPPVTVKSASFRTFPTAGSRGKFRLAFGGGAGFVPPHERMWDTIAQFEPLALLLLGDNTYIDDPESLMQQQYTYQRRQSRPEFRRLTARTAVFSIWDDHDFGTNDCWGGPLVEIPFWKKDYAWTTWKQNWPNPGFGGGAEQPGCWYSFSIGDVDFIMLDCRYYRTSPELEHPSMLGPVQLEWLQQTLSRCRGTFKVICSSVPWDFRTKGDSFDTWNGYREERERVFQMIERAKMPGVILMSADRHRSDAWKIERENGYDLVEFNSSRLTNQHVHPTMEKAGAIFSYNAKQSFGLVTFDSTGDDPQVTYEVVSIDGEKVHSISIRLSELQP